jgi:hypothetical protein
VLHIGACGAHHGHGGAGPVHGGGGGTSCPANDGAYGGAGVYHAGGGAGCLHSWVVGLNDMLLAHTAELTAGVTSTAAAMGTNAIAKTRIRR